MWLRHSGLEIKVLKAFAEQQRRPAPDSLGLAVRLVAQIGGYVYRARAPPPAPRSCGAATSPSSECASAVGLPWSFLDKCEPGRPMGLWVGLA